MSSLDWFPTLVAAAGDTSIVDELLKGKQFGDSTYWAHLDGYNQINLITGKGSSNRHEIWYFAEANLGAVRIDDFKYVFLDQPQGWFGPKVELDWPQIYNLRLDPFECASVNQAPPSIMQFYAQNFWRFVYAQKEVAKLGQTFIDFPPQQQPSSFNIEQIRNKIQKAIANKMSN